MHDWKSINSTDYFNSAYSIGGYNVPYSRYGESYSKHGAAYAGCVLFYDHPTIELKEYIYQQLPSPLIADSIYCLSFFVSFADRATVSIKNIGAYFTTTTTNTGSLWYIQATPQILNNNGFITDTINWTEIQGCFTAQGGEQFITIGNFNSNVNTDTLHTKTINPITTSTVNFSYYYIDSVSLWQNNFPTFVKEDKKGEVVSVYPNPANTILNIALTNLYAKETLSIKLTDLIGREILTSAYKEQLDISALEKGIYFLSVEQGSKRLGVKKIIKE